MSGRLKSDDAVTTMIGERLKKEKENRVSDIFLSGESNLPFTANLQSICGEAGSILEAYREFGQAGGETVTAFGDGFEEIDSQYAGQIVD